MLDTKLLTNPWQYGYQAGFAILAIPAIVGLSVLLIVQRVYPNPRDFEPPSPDLDTTGLPRLFWIYLGAIALIAAGYADFPLIAFHLQQTGVNTENQIPLLYALAMGVDAVAALVFGRWFDRVGLWSLMLAVLLSLLFAPLVFLGNAQVAVFGMVLWGIGMGAQESIMKAAVAGIVPANRRGSAFGIFNTGYGLAWFTGSALMGILYDISQPLLIIFSVLIQAAAIPVLVIVTRRMRTSRY